MKIIHETSADKEIRECLITKKSFSVVAGAGSGKTTSLITALDYLREAEGAKLRRDSQRIVCITYTNRAVDVISGRLDWDDLFYVSTLHGFLWGEIRRFQDDIQDILRNQIIPAQILKKKKDDNGGTSKKAIAARERIEALTADIEALSNVKSFEYGNNNFSDYAKGTLCHDDIIDISASLILKHKILKKILSQKYPYIFVDEAQDTFGNVIEALNSLSEGAGCLPVVGYFGDPMQQIYDNRSSDFSSGQNSTVILKQENFRCSNSVISLLNAFRVDIKQFAAGKNADVDGSVLLRIVKAEEPEGSRNSYTESQLARTSAAFDEALKHWGWAEKTDTKRLFLVRQMIARHLGFVNLHRLFTGKVASSKAQEEYEKGQHFLLKPFVDTLCPLMRANHSNDVRAVLDILRRSSPAFDPAGINAERTLGEMRTLSVKLLSELSSLWAERSIRDILKHCAENSICTVSTRLSEHLFRDPRTETYDESLHENDKGDWLADEFLGMRTNEIIPYSAFVQENTPWSTQHGVKGEEYKNVVVVFDDVEAAWNNYSFIKTLTPQSFGSPTDSQFDRSKKLAYVCFSRAEENLRILLFNPDPEAAKRELIASGFLPEEMISTVV